MACPFCGKPKSSFRPYNGRKWARCPWCRSLERHRRQVRVARSLGVLDSPMNHILHLSPEPCISRVLSKLPGEYRAENRVNIDVDLRHTEFTDGCFTLVWASHIMEHILEVDTAIAEVHRILQPGGWAMLDVPIFRNTTHRVEPSKRNHQHYWSPGPDWVERYRKVGFVVHNDVFCRRPK